MNGEIVPLKRLVGINERALAEDTDPDREFRYIDIGAVGHGELVTDPEHLRFGDAPSRARRIVKLGDTIVSTVRTYLRAVWPVFGDADQLVVSTGFAVLTPHRIDARFLSWWARSDPFIEEVVARSVGVSYPAINAVDLGGLPVRVPQPGEQRAIADFLDTETAFIDALITKRRHMIRLLAERRSSFLEGELVSVRATQVALRHLLSRPVTDGPHETPEFVDDGVPFMSVDNIVDGQIVFQDCRHITLDDHLRFSRKVRPVRGDVLLTKAASVGRVAVVKSDVDFNIWSPIAILRPKKDVVDSEFLALWLQCGGAQQQIAALSTSNTQRNIAMRDIADLRVEIPAPVDQLRVTRSMNDVGGRISFVSEVLRHQVNLLQERRQALITAAVSGELEIPGAAA